MDLIYDYLRGRQMFSRIDFVDQFAAPVLLFRRLKQLDENDMQRSTLSGRGLMSVHKLLQEANREIIAEAHQARVLRLLEGKVYRVGRSRELDLVLGDTTVSKFHAQLVCQSNVVTLTDLQSKNGTRVRGEVLSSGGSRVLQSGDDVSFGDVVVRYLSAPEFYDELTHMTRPKTPVERAS